MKFKYKNHLMKLNINQLFASLTNCIDVKLSNKLINDSINRHDFISSETLVFLFLEISILVEYL